MSQKARGCRRCNKCQLSWPRGEKHPDTEEPLYEVCPSCEQPTFDDASRYAMPVALAWSKHMHFEFERFYAQRELERDIEDLEELGALPEAAL